MEAVTREQYSKALSLLYRYDRERDDADDVLKALLHLFNLPEPPHE